MVLRFRIPDFDHLRGTGLMIWLTHIRVSSGHSGLTGKADVLPRRRINLQLRAARDVRQGY